jgi:hypothetical protein
MTRFEDDDDFDSDDEMESEDEVNRITISNRRNVHHSGAGCAAAGRDLEEAEISDGESAKYLI